MHKILKHNTSIIYFYRYRDFISNISLNIHEFICIHPFTHIDYMIHKVKYILYILISRVNLLLQLFYDNFLMLNLRLVRCLSLKS